MTVTNASLMNLIGASVQENVSALKQYINCYNQRYEATGGNIKFADRKMNHLQGNVSMNKSIADQLSQRAAMYDGKKMNAWQNEELRNELFADVLNSASGFIAGEAVGTFITSKFIGGWKGVLLSFGWDILEVIANNASGKSMDALDALYNSIFTMQLECDSEVVTGWYGDLEKMDLYRQLAWIQLKSYYLTRMNYVAYRYSTKWEQYETEMPVLAAENAELLDKMAVLMYGDVGVTQESLDDDYNHWETENEQLKDILYDEPADNEDSVTNELISGVWLQNNISDPMQFDFLSDETLVRYYAVVSNIAEYSAKYTLENNELKIEMVNLDGSGQTDIYFDLSYSEDENLKYLTVEYSSKNDNTDVSRLYGMESLMAGTYIQVKKDNVRKSLGVPDDMSVEILPGEVSYWYAAEMFTTYFSIEKDGKCIASVSVDALTGEWAKDILTYSD